MESSGTKGGTKAAQWHKRVLAAAIEANEFGADRRAIPRLPSDPRPPSLPSSTAEALRMVEDCVREALRILACLPGDDALASLRGGRSGLASMIVCEPGEDDRPMIVRTAADIDWAQGVVDALLGLKSVEPFAIKIVVYRALPRRKKWEDIAYADPKRRCRRQLNNLRDEALASLWFVLKASPRKRT